MENYDLTQTPTEEQEVKEFDIISVQEVLLALLPKAMEAEF